MKSLEELKIYYETDLVPILEKLDVQRRKFVSKICLIIVIFFIVWIMIVLIYKHYELFSYIGLGFSSIMFLVWKNSKFRGQFKHEIILKVSSFVEPSLKYSPKNYISILRYNASGLFEKASSYSGDDYFSGRIGSTSIEFSEICATKEEGRTSRLLFKGLFFIADFNKDFQGRTIILPERMFKKKRNLVKTEDPEFEKLFNVYGTDQIEARYILSQSLMQRIKLFKKKTKHNLCLSFVYSNVFVAISFKKELFEPKYFSSIVDFEPIREYYEDLNLALGIVEDLNLNTRIWTKR